MDMKRVANQQLLEEIADQELIPQHRSMLAQKFGLLTPQFDQAVLGTYTLNCTQPEWMEDSEWSMKTNKNWPATAAWMTAVNLTGQSLRKAAERLAKLARNKPYRPYVIHKKRDKSPLAKFDKFEGHTLRYGTISSKIASTNWTGLMNPKTTANTAGAPSSKPTSNS